MLRLALIFVVVILSSAAANDFWLTPEEGIGDGLAGLLGGGGGGIATKTVCGFRVAEGPKDIFQCYTPGDDGICRRGGFYASITRLPAVGKIDALDKDVRCYRYKEEAYIAIETSIPEQVRDTVVYNPALARCFSDSLACQKSLVSPDSLKYDEKVFYSCLNTETTPEGCPISEKGLVLVYNERGELLRWNERALQLYLALKSEYDVTKFMTKADREYERRFHYDILYPWKYGSGDAFVLGKESVQKSKGMEFYSVLQKTERKAMQFTSVQEALDACKGWSAK